ncbi:hypothetical protein EIP91_004792, partial [Steccherinum ochraceum]
MPQPPTAAFVFGGFFILATIAFVLYGIVIAQVWTYAFTPGKRDPWILRINVALVLVVETFHTIMAIHSIYWYLIINSGRPQELAKIVWSGAATVLCEAVMVVLVHSFYIRRIYIMSGHKKWLIGILVAILFTRTTFSLASTTLMYTLGLWAAFTETTGSLFTVSM